MESVAWLIVEKGEVDFSDSGVNVGLAHGRSCERVCPRMDCSSAERMYCGQCCICQHGEKLVLCDLGGTEGTMVNGNYMATRVPYILSHGDLISMSDGKVILRFAEKLEKVRRNGRRTRTTSIPKTLPMGNAILDDSTRQFVIDGYAICLTCKEWRLMTLLFRQLGKVVGYDEIKRNVWTERCTKSRRIPDVTMDEINVLVYRLRRKMGPRSMLLRTVRSCGYMMELTK